MSSSYSSDDDTSVHFNRSIKKEDFKKRSHHHESSNNNNSSKKRKQKYKKRGRGRDENNHDNCYEDNGKKKKKEKKYDKIVKDKKRNKKKRYRGSSSDDSDSDSSTGANSSNYSNSSSSRSYSSDYQSRKRKKKNSATTTSSHSRYIPKRNKHSSSSSKSTSKSASTSLSSKFQNLLPKLHNLLSCHPDLSTELPYLLIKLCSGSSISLSQIQNNDSLKLKLRELFFELGCTNLNNNNDSNDENFIFDDHGQWKHNHHQHNNDERALVLVKLVRFVMNQNGMTMEAIHDFEMNIRIGKEDREKEEVLMQSISLGTKKNVIQEDKISSLVTMLLDTFQQSESQSESQSTSSLAQELGSIMQMILDGEIICLDGLEDVSLKLTIEQLFLIIGLVKEEIEDDEEEQQEENENYHDKDDHEKINIEKNDKHVTFGFTLPSFTSEGDDETMIEAIKNKLHKAIEASDIYHHKILQQKQSSRKKVIGPVLPNSHVATSTSSYPTDGNKLDYHDDDNEDDDHGPAPFGSHKAIARAMKGPLPPIHLNEQANKPIESQREEWMMKPGEHNFLKGIISSSNNGGGLKSRIFKNEKSNGFGGVIVEKLPINPIIQQEIDSIMDAHQAARGPSLIDQHRVKVAEEKAAKAAAKVKKGAEWNWSKKDLDADRRVDKNYLNMVMGGASKDLKNKFQGSYSAGFT